MRNVLLVESFDLRPSNQYILVRVIPSSFRFAKERLMNVRFVSVIVQFQVIAATNLQALSQVNVQV
jgi:hypothetical protein